MLCEFGCVQLDSREEALVKKDPRFRKMNINYLRQTKLNNALSDAVNALNIPDLKCKTGVCLKAINNLAVKLAEADTIAKANQYRSMIDAGDPMIPRKMDLEKNPTGTELKVAQQREREKTGRYVTIPGDKTRTRIFVRDGEDVEKKIAAYLERINNRPLRWN